MKLKTIAAWASRRLTERSTYVGLATLATSLGATALGAHIGMVGEVLPLIIGTGLVSATTSAHPQPAAIGAAEPERAAA